MAGLTCGRVLAGRGVDVTVFEASDGVGGRVRTDKQDGYLLDRGFQVTFTAYPALKRQLDLGALDLRHLDPGALICYKGQRYLLSDPIRDPQAALATAWTPYVTWADKLRTARLAHHLRGQSINELISGQDTSTEAYLREQGFSSRFIYGFIRPFYGGIFLDRSLQTSAKCFKFDYKMLAEGYAAVPGGGIGAISTALAAPLKGRLRLKTRVDTLLRDDGGPVRGVRLAGGNEQYADVVVVATPAPEAARLTGLPMPTAYVSTVNLYWHGPAPVYRGKKIILNANPRPFLNNAVQVTTFQPEAAPSGRHLLSGSTVGLAEGDDASLFARGMADLRAMFAGDSAALAALADYTPLALYRIPYAQFAQPPAIHPTLPDTRSPIPGLLFAAEFTEAASQNAAMISGEKAAEAVLARET